MPCDLFTVDFDLAETISRYTESSFRIDETDYPPVYQFFSLDKRQLRGIEKKLYPVEIRDSKDGRFVWPNNQGLDLIESLYSN